MTFDEAVHHVFANNRNEASGVLIERQQGFRNDVLQSELARAMINALINGIQEVAIENGDSLACVLSNIAMNALTLGVAIGVAMERQEVSA